MSVDPSLPDRLERIVAGVAAQVGPTDAEAAAQLSRLEEADDATLERTVRDRGEPSAARTTALRLLTTRHQRDTTLADLLAELFHDPDVALATGAVSAYPPFDRRMSERLHALLADPREPVWAEAASVLARRRDPRILRVLARWLRGSDRARFQTALDAVEPLLDPDEHLDLLERTWDRGDLDDLSRLDVAWQLARRNQEKGLEHLGEVALGLGRLSAQPADLIFDHDPELGLDLIERILNQAAPEVQLALAERIAQRGSRHHETPTADALAKARAWLRAQRNDPQSA